ncbi:MAG: ABC transporter permease [Bacteroidales bacterium]|nr:ABC transporter permease [Bacteroidales bacterium]
MNYLALLQENLRVSIGAIFSNFLRTILTILIIAFGIMALVGILTAIHSIRFVVNKQFATMGTNTFTIESRSFNVQIGNKKYRRKNHPYINYRQAIEFKERFRFPATVSVSTFASPVATVKYRSKKTNPNVTVIGADESYLFTAGYELKKGRNIAGADIFLNRNTVIVGSSIVKKLFKDGEDPLEKEITIGNGRYIVTGVLKEKGESFNSSDNLCIIPYSNVRQYFSVPRRNYSISVTPDSRELYDAAVGYAEGLFRIVRNLDVRDEADFNITSSDFLSDIMNDVLKKVLYATTIIGFITLFGAAIGLMNIMLVQVSERTREIGIRKAIGARNNLIKQQFLFEAVLICQLGGILGIILGIFIGNIVSLILKSSFVIPWMWILGGLILCFIVGLGAGMFPAIKAAKLNPIVALHYE